MGLPLKSCCRWFVLVVAVAAAALAGCSSGPETSAPAEDNEVTAAPGVRRALAPMFSAEYVAAVSDLLDLEADDVAALEQRLSEDPNDWTARLKIMAYDGRGDRAELEASRERRVRYTLWLIEHQPDSEILASPSGPIPPGQLSDEEYRRAADLWEAALAARAEDARVVWNASRFYRAMNPQRYTECLKKAVSLDAGNEHYARELGWLYAGAITQELRGDSSGGGIHVKPDTARHELETTSNSALLEAAVHMLKNEYNRSRMIGQPDSRFAEIAQKYFRRAEKLNPGVDRAWVYPHLDPRMEGMLGANPRPPAIDQQRSSEPVIRRLSIDSFPHIPSAVAKVLRERGCLVPQTSAGRSGDNVISGEFFAPGQMSWAVLCSIDGHSAIVVFSDASGTKWEDVAPVEDSFYVQDVGDGVVGYSRQISAVNRQYILRHYRAYGGPEPPPINHQGIDDSFLEKASIIHYRHQDTWLRLTGAD